MQVLKLPFKSCDMLIMRHLAESTEIHADTIKAFIIKLNNDKYIVIVDKKIYHIWLIKQACNRAEVLKIQVLKNTVDTSMPSKPMHILVNNHQVLIPQL